MTKQGNVLFITLDQLRADVVFGNLAGQVDMPALRSLMTKAVTFTRNYSVSNPCGPSRASILTGQYAMNHRSVRNGSPLRHDIPNVATEARKAGYLPLLFGYTDTSRDPRVHAPGDPALKTYEHPLHGFHEVVEMRSEESRAWRAHLMAKGYGNVPAYPDLYIPKGSDDRSLRVDDPAFYSAKDSDTAFLTNAFLTDLATRDDGAWFSHLTFIRPHPPLVAPAPYNRMYDPETLGHPQGMGYDAEAAVHPFFGPALAAIRPKNIVRGFSDLPDDAATARAMRALYFGLATEVDHHIGRILITLRESGQLDRTLVIITADHGEMLGDRQAWGKMSCYDAAYHTPLIIRDPRNAGAFGSKVDAFTEAVDIAPTILDWMGQEIPSSMDGYSLLPFLTGGDPDTWRDHSYSELDFADPIDPTPWQRWLNLPADIANLAILRNGRHTLVHFNAGLPPLLFDHAGDGEMRDIAGIPEAAPILLEMTQALLSHRMQHADRTLSATMITPEGAVRAPRQPPLGPRPDRAEWQLG